MRTLSALAAALLVICISGTVLSKPVPAQSAPISQNIEGLGGSICVIPNVALNQVVIVFNSRVQRNLTSNQIVFVAQGKYTETPASWSGEGRLLVGDGILMVVPEEPTSNAPIDVFKFPERQLPKSVGAWRFSSYDIYGLARYGEKAPLTQAQIAQLATTGSPLVQLPH